MGYVRFNAALGESQTLVGEWVGAKEIARWLMRAAARRQLGRHLCRRGLSDRRRPRLLMPVAVLLAARLRPDVSDLLSRRHDLRCQVRL